MGFFFFAIISLQGFHLLTKYQSFFMTFPYLIATYYCIIQKSVCDGTGRLIIKINK